MNLHERYKEVNLTTKFLLPSINLPDNSYNWERLKFIGFVNCFLEDENYKENTYPNCILLVFQPSVEIFNSDKWERFLEAIKMRSNLVDIVNYNHRISGFWFKIEPVFGDNLLIYFKLGKYSAFPISYKKVLKGKYAHIVNKDKNYQELLEKDLLLPQGILDQVELEEIPKEKDIKLIKI